MADQLFNDEQPAAPQATPEQTNTPVPTSSDLFADQLAAIKNEAGEQKYTTPEKALEALKHSQQFIPELKAKAASQEQVINELTAKLEAMKSVEDIINQQTPQQVDEPTSPTLGQEDIMAIVTNALSERSAQDTQAANQSQVSKALTQKYGDNAQAEIVSKAKQLGMKPSELGALSKSNPAMVLALFGEKVGTTSTTSSSYNLSATPQAIEPVKAPTKSVLSGATAKEQAAHMAEIRAEIYRKHGITQ